MTDATTAQLDTRVIQLQRSHNALAAEVAATRADLAATASAIRAQLAATYSSLTAQIGTDEAELASLLTTVYLTTTRPDQAVFVTNPGTVTIRVALLCVTTNVGTLLTIPPGSTGSFTDAQSGDSLRIVSVDPFTARLG